MLNTETESRIFKDRSEIPHGIIDDGYGYCLPDTVKIDQQDYDLHFAGGTYIPITYAIVKNAIVGIQSSTADCVDCRLKGGTTVKPGFWH